MFPSAAARWSLALAVLIAACVTCPVKAQTAANPLKGAVTIAPLKGLLQPLIDAANGVNPGAGSGPSSETVSVLIPPGRSEHGYEAPPSRLMKFKDADIVVLVGLGLEPQVEKFLVEHPAAGVRGRRTIEFARSVGIEAEVDADHHHHDHGPDEPCNHGSADPHLWLDPVLVEQFASVLTREVAAAVAGDSAAVGRVESAGAALKAQVRAVHEEYALTCGGFRTRTLVVGHDAWRRLAERYGLSTVAIAGLTASEPSPKALERAKSAILEHRLKVVFAEPQLSDRAAARIAEATKTTVRRLDPLGTGDWAAMMRANLAELSSALGSTDQPSEAAKR